MSKNNPKNNRKFSKQVTSGNYVVITAEWNEKITSKLKEGAVETLKKLGVPKKNIIEYSVPGCFELPLAAKMITTNYNVNAIICLGCVIQGDTPHFDYVCAETSRGIMNVQLETNKPVIFGVLTTLNEEQAFDRIGGAHGHKGEEAAFTALTMADLAFSVEKNGDRDPLERLMDTPMGQQLAAAMMNPNFEGIELDDDDEEFEFDDEDEEDTEDNKLPFKPKK